MNHDEFTKNWNPERDGKDEAWLRCVELLKEADTPRMPSETEFCSIWSALEDELNLDGVNQSASPDLPHSGNESGVKPEPSLFQILFFQGGMVAQTARFAAVFVGAVLLSSSWNSPSQPSLSTAALPLPEPTPEVITPTVVAQPVESKVTKLDPKDYVPLDIPNFPHSGAEDMTLISLNANNQLQGFNQLSSDQMIRNNAQSNTGIAKQRLLNSLQQMKFDSIVENDTTDLIRIHEMETNLALLMRDEFSVPKSEILGIEIFQKAERALASGQINDAMALYERVQETVPGTFLAFLTRYRTASVKMEMLGRFDEALEDFQLVVSSYPAHFLNNTQKRTIVQQMQFLTENQEADWAGLKLWYQSRSQSPADREVTYVEMIRNHGTLPITQRVASELADSAIKGTLSINVETLASALHSAGELHENSPLAGNFYFLEAEIQLQRLLNREAAEAAYKKVLEQPVNNKIMGMSKVRLQQLAAN